MAAEQESALSTWLEDRFRRSAGEIRAYIKAEFGLRYSHSGSLKLLRRLGFEFREPKAQPLVADETKQAEFIAFYEALITSLPAPLGILHCKTLSAVNEAVYFADAVHSEHPTKPAFGWVRNTNQPNC
jgi:hypothetical protein